MARPKRTKIASAAPIAHSTSNTNRPAAIPKYIASSHSSSPDSVNSDDSEGLVTKARSATSRNATAPQDVRMSGALAIEDGAGSTPLRPPSRKQRAALTKIVRDADHAKAIEARLRSKDWSTRSNNKRIMVDLMPPFLIDTHQHQLTAQAGRKQAFTFENEAKTHPTSVTYPSPTLQTPALGSSTSALLKFRRRPRQASILQIGQGDSSLPVDGSDRDHDGFSPDDESTPFFVTGKRLNSSHESRSTPLPTPSSVPPTDWTSLQLCKLPPSVVQMSHSQASPTQSLSSSVKSGFTLPSKKSWIKPDVSKQSIAPLPFVRQQDAPDGDSGSTVLATPKSSSPSQTESLYQDREDARVDRHKLDRGSKRKCRSHTQPTGQLSTSPLKICVEVPSRFISTASLQTFLPRRQAGQSHHIADEFEIPNMKEDAIGLSNPTDDDDELALASLPARRLYREDPASKLRTRTIHARNAVPLLPTTQKARPKTQHDARTKTTGMTRTYSRQTSDKENSPSASNIQDEDEGVDRSSLHSSPDPGIEKNAVLGSLKSVLAVQMEKFKEIDEWEMQFEEVTASSSSPHDGR